MQLKKGTQKRRQHAMFRSFVATHFFFTVRWEKCVKYFLMARIWGIVNPPKPDEAATALKVKDYEQKCSESLTNNFNKDMQQSQNIEDFELCPVSATTIRPWFKEDSPDHSVHPLQTD